MDFKEKKELCINSTTNNMKRSNAFVLLYFIIIGAVSMLLGSCQDAPNPRYRIVHHKGKDCYIVDHPDLKKAGADTVMCVVPRTT